MGEGANRKTTRERYVLFPRNNTIHEGTIVAARYYEDISKSVAITMNCSDEQRLKPLSRRLAAILNTTDFVDLGISDN